MLHAERDEIKQWCDNLPSDYVFNFKKELEQYCIQDVNILRMACLRFRQLMIQTAGLCPFSRSPTFAGYSHLVYRTRFIPENTTGVIPSNNYVSRMNTSHFCVTSAALMVARHVLYLLVVISMNEQVNIYSVFLG